VERAGQPGSLSQVDELFLMLVRLHLDLKESDLVHQFEISQFTVSWIFFNIDKLFLSSAWYVLAG